MTDTALSPKTYPERRPPAHTCLDPASSATRGELSSFFVERWEDLPQDVRNCFEDTTSSARTQFRDHLIQICAYALAAGLVLVTCPGLLSGCAPSSPGDVLAPEPNPNHLAPGSKCTPGDDNSACAYGHCRYIPGDDCSRCVIDECTPFLAPGEEDCVSGEECRITEEVSYRCVQLIEPGQPCGTRSDAVCGRGTTCRLVPGEGGTRRCLSDECDGTPESCPEGELCTFHNGAMRCLPAVEIGDRCVPIETAMNNDPVMCAYGTCSSVPELGAEAFRCVHGLDGLFQECDPEQNPWTCGLYHVCVELGAGTPGGICLDRCFTNQECSSVDNPFGVCLAGICSTLTPCYPAT